MLIDSLISFVGPNTPLSLVGGTGVGIPSSVIDLLGAGVGVAPPNIFGTASVFGEDAGIGQPRMQSEVLVTTAFVTANASTLNIAFQGAADTGLAGGYLPGAWTTLIETGYLAATALTLGAVLARFDWPPAVPPSFKPRFLRLLFQPLAATNFTAGAVLAPSTMGRDDTANLFIPHNFSVGTTG